MDISDHGLDGMGRGCRSPIREPEDVLFRAQTEHASMYSRTPDFMDRLGVLEPRQSVWFYVPGARPVGQSERKMIKEQSPLGLARIKPLSLPNVLQVLVVCPQNKWMQGPFQPMSPLFKGDLHSQQFPVADVVIALRRAEPPGQEGAGMHLAILRPLRQHCPNAVVRRIHLHHELLLGIWKSENG